MRFETKTNQAATLKKRKLSRYRRWYSSSSFSLRNFGTQLLFHPLKLLFLCSFYVAWNNMKGLVMGFSTKRCGSFLIGSTKASLLFRSRPVNFGFAGPKFPIASTISTTSTKKATEQTRDSFRLVAVGGNNESLCSSNDKQSKRKRRLVQLFDLQLPEGRCVALRLDDNDGSLAFNEQLSREAMNSSSHWIHEVLHPEEVAYALSIPSDPSRRSFLLGRLTMRQALKLQFLNASEILKSTSILKDEYGRPTVPSGFLGSISHKNTTGVALVSRDTLDSDSSFAGQPKRPRLGIGIDIEHKHSKRRDVAQRVLTESEISQLGCVKGLTRDEEILLRFSLKESLYKAMHPLICQYVGFQEVEITPNSDNTASVHFNLKSGAHKRFEKVTAHWRKLEISDGFFLSSASVMLKDDDDDDSGRNDNSV